MLSHVRLIATPWTVACQAPLSTGFSRQEYWSGLPLPSPGDLPHPGIEPTSHVAAQTKRWAEGIRSQRPWLGEAAPQPEMENSMDRGAWQIIVHGIAKNRTQLSE